MARRSWGKRLVGVVAEDQEWWLQDPVQKIRGPRSLGQNGLRRNPQEQVVVAAVVGLVVVPRLVSGMDMLDSKAWPCVVAAERLDKMAGVFVGASHSVEAAVDTAAA